MPYVARDQSGAVYGIWATEQHAGQEFLPNGHADLIRPEPIPRSVTMRQARIALARSGLLASVDTALAAMTGQAGDEARIEWEFSSMVERDRSLVQSLAAGIGLTEQQLDDLFALASTL